MMFYILMKKTQILIKSIEIGEIDLWNYGKYMIKMEIIQV